MRKNLLEKVLGRPATWCGALIATSLIVGCSSSDPSTDATTSGGGGNNSGAGGSGGSGGSGGDTPEDPCGNGMLDEGEDCDDGAMNSDTAACTSMCKKASCGDGLVQDGVEDCDEGDANSDTAACTSTCKTATCGDGLVQDGVEGCDEGDANSDSGACTTLCKSATCGDGVVQDGVEECDDGDANSDTAACTSLCKPAMCGDGLVQDGVEECDAGMDNADTGACTSMCKAATCGDGFIQEGVEECEDGNDVDGDGCNSCMLGGAFVWEKEAQNAVLWTDMTVDAAGNIYTAGTKLAAGNNDIVVRKADKDGMALWEKTYDEAGLNDSGASVAVDAAGNVYVAGAVTVAGATDTDAFVAKYDSAGGLVWKVYDIGRGLNNGPGEYLDDSAAGVAVDAAGNVFITGTATYNKLGDTDVLVVKYSATSTLLAKNYIGTTEPEYGNDITLDSSGNPIIAGYQAPGGAFVLMADPNLTTTVWADTYIGSGNADATAFGVTVDKDNNVIATGWEFVDAGKTNQDLWLRKYTTTGNLLWSKTYGGADMGPDAGQAVTTDALGNIVVAGQTYVEQTKTDFLVRKYSPAGDVMWSTVRDSGTGNEDSSRGVAVVADGVLVAGYESNANVLEASWTLKFSP